MLRNRYRTFARSLEKTVPALRRSGAVRGTVEALRSEGWLDWHILTAILNIVVNYRHPVTPRDLRRPYAREEMVRAAFEPENETSRLTPAHLFSPMRCSRLGG